MTYKNHPKVLNKFNSFPKLPSLRFAREPHQCPSSPWHWLPRKSAPGTQATGGAKLKSSAGKPWLRAE